MPTPILELLSRTIYNTDSITTIWNFNFAGGYIDKSHVKAYVEYPSGARDYLTVVSSDVVGESQLRISPALVSGNKLIIYRSTPKELPIVDFTDGSGLSELALDTNARQAVFIGAESADTVANIPIGSAIDSAYAAAASAASAAASLAAINANVGEGVSVRAYGALGLGANYRTQIQAAVDANPGKKILIPAGDYWLDGPITVSTTGTRIEGEGERVTKIRVTSTTEDAFVFTSTSPTTGGLLAACGISGMEIYRYVNSTAGSAVKLVQCSGFNLSDLRIVDNVQGIRVIGGTLNSLTKFRVYSTDNLVGTVVGSSLLSFESQPLTVGKQVPYTTNVTDFFLAGTKHIDRMIDLRAGDGISFSDGYVGNAVTTNLRVSVPSTQEYISAVSFSGVYFDGVDYIAPHTNATQYGMLVSDSVGIVYDIKFVNCEWANYLVNCFNIDTPVRSLSVVNSSFINAYSYAVVINTTGRYIFSATRFRGVGIASTSGAILTTDVETITVNNCNFVSISGATATAIKCYGSSEDGSIVGCSFSNLYRDIDADPGVFSHGFALAGNTTLCTVQHAAGLATSNKNNPDSHVLDWYKEDSFVPALSFGGASVGVTYGTRQGYSTRVGNIVSFNATLTLTSKGSSTGTVRIDGLLFANALGFPATASVTLNGVGATVGDSDVSAWVSTGSTSIEFRKMVSGFAVELTNADITNTSVFYISGTYKV